jgi:hypothetical protein
MITLTRRLARCLRGVLRRSALGLPRSGPVAPLVLRADGRQLRAQYRYSALAVEHASPCPRGDSGALAIPPEALADLEGRDESPVAIEPAGPGRVAARWSDRGIPAAREYDAPDPATLAAMPEPPEPWHEAPPGLLDALAAACSVAGEDSPRYSLSCLQLRGGRGELAATDGRQLLVQAGLAFPWEGDLLVPRCPALARPELPRDDGVDVGLAGDFVALRAGPWTLWLAVRQGVRFPDVDRAVPAQGSAATRLRLHPADARFLADALDRLPGEEGDGAVTLDLGERVVVRARGESGPATELVLARSSCTGPAARVATGRAYLARAARLGFVELEVSGPEAPLCGRDGRRTYAWQPLGEAAAVGPADDAVSVASTAAEPPAPAQTPARIAAATTLRTPGAPAPPRPAAPGGMTGLIEEAAALHAALRDARSRAARLVAALRAERRRSRLLAVALDQIRQLRLQDVAG